MMSETRKKEIEKVGRLIRKLAAVDK